jgi:hypothetical protein
MCMKFWLQAERPDLSTKGFLREVEGDSDGDLCTRETGGAPAIPLFYYIKS